MQNKAKNTREHRDFLRKTLLELQQLLKETINSEEIFNIKQEIKDIESALLSYNWVYE